MDERKRINVNSRFTICLCIILISYTILLIYWMFLGFNRSYTPGALRYNIIPFRTLSHYFMNFNAVSMRTWIINICGNIGVFIPFGLLLPLLCNKTNRLRTFMVMFLVPLFVVEWLQTFLHRGSFDVDDLLLNSIGALIGWGTIKLLRGYGFSS
ncbi:VanZ like family protein [compost metagenome]